MRAIRTFIAVALGGLASGCEDRPQTDAGGKAVEQAASAGPVSVLLILDRTHLTTAEHVTLTIEVTAPTGTVASPPDLAVDFGGFTVVEQGRAAPRLVGEDRLLASMSYVLEPFLPGDYTIPSIDVTYADGSGKTGVVKTGPMAVVVASVLSEGEQEPAEIGPARDVVDPAAPARSRPLALAITAGSVLVAIGVALVGWRLLRRRVRVPTDPCVVAERRLGTLQGLSFSTPAAARAAVEEASSLLRACLANRIDPGAVTRTTDELLSAPAIARSLSELDMSILRAGLAQSDAAKFAGAPVSEAQARAMMAETLGLIRTLSSMVARPSDQTSFTARQEPVPGGPSR